MKYLDTLVYKPTRLKFVLFYLKKFKAKLFFTLNFQKRKGVIQYKKKKFFNRMKI